ncbi:hypothetical protein [Sunxiuqinia indica]|uniref:hypothetical protein n=1 Tax=Sunxiuqinia indica TaxID=2692584 RepID=UPI00135A620A|nr:hypothetical protein [Sunxiuqinia indica]
MSNYNGLANLISVITDFITVFALITGGIWALWKWGYLEKIRKKKEMPAIDGILNFKLIEINELQVVVSFEAIWSNKGSFAIYLNSNDSHLNGKKIKKKSVSNGALETENIDIQEKLFSGKYILEPQTNSIMQKQIILHKKDTYLFEWIIGLDEKHAHDFHTKGVVFCSREIVINPEFELRKLSK